MNIYMIIIWASLSLFPTNRNTDSSGIIDRLPSHLSSGEAKSIVWGIQYASTKYNIDPTWLEAIAIVESGNWSHKKSITNDWGYWQVNIKTFRYINSQLSYLGVRKPHELFNPIIGAEFGAYYLYQMLKLYKSYDKAIMAYNVGPGGLKTSPERARAYYRRVYNAKQEILKNK